MFKAYIYIPGLAAVLLTGAAYADIPRHTCSDSNITPTTSSERFTAIDDGSVVRHKRTGLEWQRCAVGQSWNGAEARCDGAVTGHSWQEALQEADAQDGWRLPDIKELRTIVEQCTRMPAINTKVFPDTPPFRYWSSSPVAADPNKAWYVHFNAGHQRHIVDKDGINLDMDDSDLDEDENGYNHAEPFTVAVRLVRDGQ